MASNKRSSSFNKQKEIEKKRRKKRKIRLTFFIVIVIITGIISYLLNSSIFNIEDIEVVGNSQLNKQEIIEQSEIKLGKSIFTVSDVISKVRIKQNGYIEDVKVIKKMPNIIKIEVKERTPEFQIRTENGIYIYIDEQGYIIDYSQELQDLVTITGMEITEENIEKKKRLEDDDLNIKLENILHIKEEATDIGIYDKISEIQTRNEYILILSSLNLTINLGNGTNIKDRMDYVKSIMEKENGNSGTINVNGNLNEGFIPYFTESQ